MVLPFFIDIDIIGAIGQHEMVTGTTFGQITADDLPDYENNHWDTSGQSNHPSGITTDNTSIWIVDRDDLKVYRYDMAGAYLDFIDISGNCPNPWGITVNSGATHLWIYDYDDLSVHRYTVAGVHVDSFPTLEVTEGSGITTNGTYIWVICFFSDRVYRYNMAGTYIDSFDISGQMGGCGGIDIIEGYLWIADFNGDTIYQYYTNGTYMDNSFSVGSQSNDPTGLTVNSAGYLWITDIGDDEVYRYDINPTFDISRVSSTSLETNYIFSFNPNVNCTGNVTLQVPVSDGVLGIYNVTNNTGDVMATSVTSMASLVNNTYYYDDSVQMVYIRTVNLLASSGVNWTVNCSYGTFAINCYDENTSNAITCWDIFISNKAGTQTYESLCNNNTLNISVSDIPYGDDTFIKISATNYSFRIYYIDIDLDEQFTLNAYLADVNDTESYLLRVTNEYQNPVVDAKVQVQRYINDTLGYEDVSIMLTDGNGYCPSVWLIPDEDYAARIVASGYVTERFIFNPIPIVYVEDRYFTFQLSFTEEDYDNETIYDEIITFNGYISGTTLYINYTDTSSLTINTAINVYEYNTSNTSVVKFCSQDSRTGIHSFQISKTINSSNCYEVTLDLNHTTFGYIHGSFIVCGRTTLTSKTTFDNLFDINFGYNPFGWSNTFGLFLLIATLFSFGQRNSGISLLLCGFILLGVNSVIGLALITVSIPVIFICLGILVQWTNQRREYG